MMRPISIFCRPPLSMFATRLDLVALLPVCLHSEGALKQTNRHRLKMTLTSCGCVNNVDSLSEVLRYGGAQVLELKTGDTIVSRLLSTVNNF